MYKLFDANPYNMPSIVSIYMPKCSVIKIILQFCKENSLTESFNAIQVCERANNSKN